jgi:hypothetical protein
MRIVWIAGGFHATRSRFDGSRCDLILDRIISMLRQRSQGMHVVPSPHAMLPFVFRAQAVRNRHRQQPFSFGVGLLFLIGENLFDGAHHAALCLRLRISGGTL